jgi:polysaccharide biosynthesis protein VpsM
MITKQRLALLTTLVAAPAFAAPFLAIGNNAELFVTSRLQATFDDNITLASSEEKDDFIFEFAPGAELVFGKNAQLKGKIFFEERLIAYSDNEEFNDQLANFGFSSSYDNYSNLTLASYATFKQSSQNNRDFVLLDALVEFQTVTAGVSGKLSLSEKSKIGTGFEWDSIIYTSTKTNGLAFDQTNYSIPFNYYFAVTPKLDLSAGVRYTSTDVKNPNFNADSDKWYFNVGAVGQFTPKLTGSFDVGYNVRTPDEGDDESGLGMHSGLKYAVNPRLVLALSLTTISLQVQPLEVMRQQSSG